mgnify:FL=1
MDNLENIIPKNKNLLGLIISEYICNCVDDNSIVITNDENKKIVNDEESDGVTVWIEPPHNLDIVEEDSIAGLKEIIKIALLSKQLNISLDHNAIHRVNGVFESLEYHQDELNEYLKNKDV